MNAQDEIRHVNEGPRPDEKVYGIGTVRFLGTSRTSSSEALARAKEVMTICLNLPVAALDDLQPLQRAMPSFFVESFREWSDQEDEAYLKQWRAAGDQKRMELQQNRRWSLVAWADWMKPENREWWWWHAIAVSNQCCAIAVAVDGWPFPWEALKVLLHNCGFDDVQPETKK